MEKSKSKSLFASMKLLNNFENPVVTLFRDLYSYDFSLTSRNFPFIFLFKNAAKIF
jgi:hypothetical protein